MEGHRVKTKVLIRGVSEELRRWLDTARPTGTSQNQFLLSILAGARDGRIEPLLFDEAVRAAIAPPPVARFTFIEIYAGIGGFRIGLTKVGGRCVFTSEWYPQAQRTYEAWFKEVPHGDINEINPKDIPDHDVLAAGFPCQPFSIAGVSKKNALGQPHGFNCDKQGNLFFRICDIIDVKRPPVLILENVKNLRSHDKGRTWAVIESELTKRNYKVFWKIIDAQAWVPQHRERIFIVCFDTAVFGPNPPFEFPELPAHEPRLGDILDPSPPAKYTLTDHLWNYLQRYAEKHREKGNGFGFGLVGPDDITRTLSARYYKDGSEILIRQPGKNPRRLMPDECARLMGFSREHAAMFGFTDGFPIVVSDTQAYKQFGNAVVPYVVAAVGQQVVLTLQHHIERSGNGCLLKGRLHNGKKQPRAALAAANA
jgi:DNA (cytosine-5)-methyltransferase 1